jgi:two-component system, OmpR family, heavy metal sensor histidine kinase CusS
MLDRLQDSFVRLDRFSADIAHELRTPVHRLRNVTEVTLAAERSPSRDGDALGLCLDAAESLGDLIDRLLFLARAEDPRRQLDRENVKVCRELVVVCEFFEAMAAEAGVELSAEAPPDLHFGVDRQLFRRAIGNLVMNALTHTHAGGKVEVHASTTAESLSVCVADTGDGIPPEHLPHLFDRFYRHDAVRTPGRGVGLGLAIVRSIAELHGGRVEVVSKPGQGSTFTLILAPGPVMTGMSSPCHSPFIGPA